MIRTELNLRPYQMEGVDFLTQSCRTILADDMGLGKSAQALETIRRFRAHTSGHRNLIICPRSVMGVWESEIEKWLGPGLSQRVDGVDRPTREKQLADPVPFTIINYELTTTYSRYEERNGKRVEISRDSRHLNTLCDIRWFSLIIDEAHRLMNRQSKAFEAIKHINRTNLDRLLLLLTGTPLINRPEELWPLLHLIDPKTYSSFWRWVDEWCLTRPSSYSRWAKDIVGVRDPSRLKSVLSETMIRRTKDEVLHDLPPKEIHTLELDLYPDQRKLYQTMKSKYWMEIPPEGLITVDSVLALGTRLRQICISPGLVYGLEDLAGVKIDTTIELVREAIESDQKVVVFSQFSTVIRGLSQLLMKEKLRCTSFTGDTAQLTREYLISEFQKSEEPGALLCTIQTGGVGVSFTAASIAVFVDSTWSPAQNDQAVSRLHRMGQLRPVTIYNLVARATIEEEVIKTLERKSALFDSVIPTRVVGDIVMKSLTVRESEQS